MDAVDYSDWLDFSGLYLGNLSHADRYRTYERKISPEGLNVRIVHDFLADNDGRVDVGRWRNFCVYEIDGGLRYRVERTAEALAAIGAERTAEAVRSSRNTTMLGRLASGLMSGEDDIASSLENVDPAQLMTEFRQSIAAAFGSPAAAGEIVDTAVDADTATESRERIAELLSGYVDLHAATLAADVERYGDVRKEPGFDPDARRRELDQIVTRQHDRESQIETIEKMRSLMEQMEKGIARHGPQAPRKMRSVRRKLLQGQREYVDRDANDLLPEMRAWLDEFRAFAARHADVFYPSPVEDAALLARLREYGDYDYDVQEFGAELSWNALRGFDGAWTRFSLTILYPDRNEEAIREALDAVDELREDAGALVERLRADVIAAFHDHVECIGGLDRLEEWFEFGRDESGGVSESEILRLAGSATLNVESLQNYDEAGVTIAAWFPVAWDEEHGLEIPLVGEEGFDPDDEGDDAF